MEPSLPTPTTARVELLIYQRVIPSNWSAHTRTLESRNISWYYHSIVLIFLIFVVSSLHPHSITMFLREWDTPIIPLIYQVKCSDDTSDWPKDLRYNVALPQSPSYKLVLSFKTPLTIVYSYTSYILANLESNALLAILEAGRYAKW